MTAALRIVSLIPSATEIVAALGFAEQLVACSHECDHPPVVEGLPRLTAPKLDPARPSAEIDRDVRTLLEGALAVYRVDAERLRALAPDVIVTQTQCEVCAVSLGDVEAALADWADGRPRLVALEPSGLADIWRDIEKVAEALDAARAGATLIAGLQARMAAVEAQARGLGAPPSVVCVEWLEPLMAAGNWVPELVVLAGGRELLGSAGSHAPTVDWPTLRAADPEVLITMPCGFDIARTREELSLLTGRPGWGVLRAARTGRVALADGNQYFNRPGPRIAESLEILAEILHPGACDYGHRGIGWRPLAG